MTEISQAQYRAQGTLDTGKMIGGEIADFISKAAVRYFLLANNMCQVACIDSHRAGHGAQPVTGTGLVAGVTVLLFQQGETFGVFTILPKAGDFSLQYNALA